MIQLYNLLGFRPGIDIANQLKHGIHHNSVSVVAGFIFLSIINVVTDTEELTFGRLRLTAIDVGGHDQGKSKFTD